MTESEIPTPDQVAAIWGRLTALRAQLCVSVRPNPFQAIDATLMFFRQGFARLGGVFYDAAMTLPPDELAIQTRLAKAVPGGISVAIGVMRHATDYHTPYRPFSAQTMSELEGAVLGLPPLVSLECRANTSDGDSQGPFFDICAQRFDHEGGPWLLLEVLGSPEVLGAEPQRAALLGVLRDVAEQCNPVHAEISWGKSLQPSILEDALGTKPSTTLPSAREFLRGYAWVTVIPEEIGRRLGGADTLRASGAFVEVEHLGGGGYWCRATPRLEDYDQAAAERVFDVVASVLPPGEPNHWGVCPPNVLSHRARPDSQS